MDAVHIIPAKIIDRELHPTPPQQIWLEMALEEEESLRKTYPHATRWRTDLFERVYENIYEAGTGVVKPTQTMKDINEEFSQEEEQYGTQPVEWNDWMPVPEDNSTESSTSTATLAMTGRPDHGAGPSRDERRRQGLQEAKKLSRAGARKPQATSKWTDDELVKDWEVIDRTTPPLGNKPHAPLNLENLREALHDTECRNCRDLEREVQELRKGTQTMHEGIQKQTKEAIRMIDQANAMARQSKN